MSAGTVAHSKSATLIGQDSLAVLVWVLAMDSAATLTARLVFLSCCHERPHAYAPPLSPFLILCGAAPTWPGNQAQQLRCRPGAPESSSTDRPQETCPEE